MSEIHREALGRLADEGPTIVITPDTPAVIPPNTLKQGQTIRVTASSGNVFADLGLPDPDLLLAASEAYGLLRSVLAEEEVRDPGSPYCRRVAEACDRLQAAFRAHGSRADAR